MANREVILHCHLFKNAGTTLDWALKRSFKRGFYDHRGDESMRRDGVRYLDSFLDSHSSIVALSSHHMPFQPEYSESYWWLVLLREPIQRVRSVYEFETKQLPISSLGSEMAKKLNFSDYIKWRMQDDVPAVIKNFQCRYLINMADPAMGLDDDALWRAHSRMSLNNVLFGTVEKFDETMVLFEESLKHHFPKIDLSYVKQNVGRESKDDPLQFLEDLDEEARRLVLNNNQWDKKLYKEAGNKLSQLTDEVSRFEEKLADFKLRCSSLVNK